MSDLKALQTQVADLRKRLAAADRAVAHARGEPAAAAARNARTSAAAALEAALGGLAALGDPTKAIEQLDDSYPIMLFPLRLETRFVQHGANHELWIRIYPDDCQVQTYTDFITDAELANVRQFWINWWKAGQDPDQQRAAWRALVARHGSGRSQLLIGRYQPAGDPPKKDLPSDMLLVVASDVPPADVERASAYWVAVWRAGKDAHARDAARQQLVADVGAAAAGQIIASWVPANLDDEPLAPFERTQVAVRVVTIALPPASSVATTATSWQQAPRVTTLPEYFVATGYRDDDIVFSRRGNRTPATLAVGPDPSLPEADQIKAVDGELTLNDDLEWLGDFEVAVARGMGMKVPLTQEQYTAGFSRLVVLGVRLTSDAEDGAQLLEALFADHQASKSGMAILPQGTPTNNTDSVPSGYTWQDDPDASYQRIFGGAAEFPLTSDVLSKRDGQWLAELLGIDVDAIRHLPHADGLDQAQARAMNTALWPTTWGYFLQTMVGSQLPAKEVEHLRTFFIRYISGRGAVPAIRIAKQPYGILPATVRSRLYLDPQTIPDSVPIPHTPPDVTPGRSRPGTPGRPTTAGRPMTTPVVATPSGPIHAGGGGVLHVTPWPLDFLLQLKNTLDTIRDDFESLVEDVPRVGGPGDPQQVLLDVIGQQASSVEYYQRYVASFAQVLNQVNLEDGPVAYLLAALVLGELQIEREKVLSKLGLDPADVPMLDKILREYAGELTGGVVDDRELSETAPIRAYTADGRNYLEWLVGSTFDVIRREDFGGQPKPRALLYMLARYALMLGYFDSSLNLLSAVDAGAAARARIEPDFLQVGAKVDGESKYRYLVQPNSQITGDATLPVAEFLDRPAVQLTPAGARLKSLRTALGVLQNASTAALERLFAEHIDLCSYRLDAWRLGLVHHRLAQQRERKARGIFLGSFGWVHDLEPDNKPLTPHPTPTGLHSSFTRSGRSPILDDASNGGYIHAPSIPQATTAAILRNAYVSHATEDDPMTMSVNLSSARVRAALEIIEGIQHGQGLAELLGYQLERGLHDAHLSKNVELDVYVFELRKHFPLVANQHTDTKAVVQKTAEAAARNVIDGLALAEHIRKTGKASYPFGLTGPDGLPTASAGESNAITAEVDRMLDLSDAVSDLLLAESVHQAVHGQMSRATAAIDAIGKGARPHEPEVIETPRSGLLLVHRVAVHVDASAVAPASATPRAAADPAIEAWLAARLPAPTDLVVAVRYEHPAHAAHELVVSQADLGLSASDVLQLLLLDGQPATSELDDRIEQRVRATVAHPGGMLTLRHLAPVAGKTTFFEVAPLVARLRTVLLHSRPLGATDLVRASDVGSEGPRWNASELAARISAQRDALSARLPEMQALETASGGTAEAYLEAAATALLGLALHGVPNTGVGALRGRVQQAYVAVTGKLSKVVARWDERRANHAAIIGSLAGLADDEARMTALRRAERAISASAADPEPPTVADYLAVLTSKLAAFDAALAALRAPLTADVATLEALLALIEPAVAAIPAFDPVWFDIDRKANDVEPERAALALLRSDLGERIAAVRADVEARIADADQLIAQALAAADPDDAIEPLEQAAARVLGAGAKVLPRFTMPTDPGAELASGFADSAQLVEHLVAGGHEFPVDEWLYGVARVRPKVGAWEGATALAEAFGREAGTLTPIQLPYRANDRWTALELAAGYTVDGEKLLYTASFAASFDPALPQSGVVLDEWTEVVPGEAETTGLTFHFDQPNNEPPQAILLATPPHFRGGWRWDDLLDTVIETFEEAKLRAVEPEKVNGTEYGQFLPATLIVSTRSALAIAANLLDNNE